MGQESTISKTYKTEKPAMFFTQPMLRDFNWMLRLLRGARGQNGITVRTSSGHLEVGGIGFAAAAAAAATAPRSFAPFLVQPTYNDDDPPTLITHAKVSMSLGWVVHGGYWSASSQTAEHFVPQEDRTVEIDTPGYSVIYLKYTYGVGATHGVVTAASETVARPLATVWGADYATRAMLCVRLTEVEGFEVLTLIREYNCGQDWCIDPIAALP